MNKKAKEHRVNEILKEKNKRTKLLKKIYFFEEDNAKNNKRKNNKRMNSQKTKKG